MRDRLLYSAPTAPTAAAPAEALWTLADTAAFLAVDPHVLYRWRARGYGPPGYKVGKVIRYQGDEVRAWLAEQGRGLDQ